MIADGEGANHVAEIRATGLANDADAKRVAQTMATSLLVKTALHGKDANWGRLLAAAGRSGVTFDPTLASIKIGEIEIVKNGLGVGAEAEKEAAEILKGPSYKIEIGLGAGPGAFSYLTSDLGPRLRGRECGLSLLAPTREAAPASNLVASRGSSQLWRALRSARRSRSCPGASRARARLAR